jgi:hypothetical protein
MKNLSTKLNKKDEIRFAMALFLALYGYRISYRTLATAVGLPVWILVFLLCQIGAEDISNGLPPSDILAVDHRSGEPSEGFKAHKIKLGHLDPNEDYRKYCLQNFIMLL